MTQLDLPAPRAEQRRQIERVSGRIASCILAFCAAHAGNVFAVADLTAYVCERHPGTAPASPDRVLRDMRRRGLVDYDVVSRAGSLYRVTAVR